MCIRDRFTALIIASPTDLPIEPPINEKSNKRILEVNLLSGPSKNRKMYILKEDLLKNFNMLDDEINENS